MENRVLVLTQYLGIGGLERMVFNLCVALKKRGSWVPQVFVYDHPEDARPESHLVEAFEAQGIPVEVFTKGRGVSFRAMWRIAREVRRRKIQAIHSHDLGALVHGVGAKIALLGRVRLVHTQHSFVHLKRKRRYRHYEKFFTRFVDELVVVSEDTRREYLNLGLAPQRVHVVPNGVGFTDCEYLTPLQKREKRHALVRSLSASVPAECTWLLYLARIHGRKGQEHALALWEQLSESQRRSMVLLFVGPETEAGELARLQTRISRSPDQDRIFVLGPTQNPQQWLEASDVFISCSEFEGMPLGPIEAAGAGLPLVLSDIAGHAIFSEFSQLFPLEDARSGGRALTRALALAARDEAPQSFAAIARSIRERYGLDGMASVYESFYV